MKIALVGKGNVDNVFVGADSIAFLPTTFHLYDK
jgi:hypothetical protein